MHGGGEKVHALEAQARGQGLRFLHQLGAGKSYLGFILYDLFFKDKPVGRVTGVETRAELVDKSQALASKLGFERMDFLATTVQQALTHPGLPATIDVVTALHACDTVVARKSMRSKPSLLARACDLSTSSARVSTPVTRPTGLSLKNRSYRMKPR